MRIVARLQLRLRRLEDGLLASLLAALLLVAIAQIVLRLFGSGLAWAEPVSRMGVLWLALLGALGATARRRHIAIDAIARLLPPFWRRVAWALTQAAAAAVCALLAWYGWGMLVLERQASTPFVAGIPSWMAMLAFPVGLTLMALRFVLAAVAMPPPLPLPGAEPPP